MTNSKSVFGDLTDRINHFRNLMIAAGLQHGLGSTETLKYSEKLDQLIVEFQLKNR